MKKYIKFIILLSIFGLSEVIIAKHRNIKKVDKQTSQAISNILKKISNEKLKREINQFLKATNKKNDSILSRAIYYSKNEHEIMELFHILLSLGADVNLLSDEYYSPLHYAIRKNYPKIIQLLIDKGANIHARTGGIYPYAKSSYLTLACQEGHLEMVKLLLDKGADINAQGISCLPNTKPGETALMIACIEGHLEIVKFLLERGANVHLTDSMSETALTLACRSPQESTAIVKLLLKYGANANISSPLTTTIIHSRDYAIPGHETKVPDILPLLLEYGADINAQQALITACQEGFTQIVKFLIEHGADTSIKNNDGKTAKDIVIKKTDHWCINRNRCSALCNEERKKYQDILNLLP